jgi:hypothetical protein
MRTGSQHRLLGKEKVAMAKISINMESLKDKKEYVRHKVNDGDNIYRILPPFGEESNGYPFRKWTIAWLLDPESGRKRPYASPFSFGKDACPVFEYCKAIEAKRDEKAAAIRTRLSEKGMEEEAIKKVLKEKLKVFNDVIWNIKPKKSFFYNAVNKAGEVGILELKVTAHDKMKKAMSQYIKDYNQDPTSLMSDADDSGVWFKVSRTGKDSDTEYNVEKNQTKVKDPSTGKLRWEDDQEPLSDNVAENYEDMAYDLAKLYREISYEDLKAVLLANIAAVCEESPELVVEGFEPDEVPAAKPQPKKKEEEAPAPKATPKKTVTLKVDDDEDEDEEPAPKKPVAKKPAPVDEDDEPAAKPQPKKKPAPTEDDDDPMAYAERLLEGM